MDIGKDKKEKVSEPLVTPVPERQPAIPSERPPERPPSKLPDHEPVKT